MATTVFELMAKIGLDSTDFINGLNNAKSNAEKVGTGIKAGMGAIAKAGAAVFTAASAATGAFVKSSVSAGMDFDAAMSQVSATLGKTTDEMLTEVGTVDLAWGTFSGNLRDYAQEMGKNTAFSATQAAEALNYMALAGYDAQTSMEMLPNVLNLAAAGSMDLATASDMVTDVQTAFGISLERTSQMVDEMAKAASTGNTSVQQLGEAFLTVGGLAGELNGGVVKLADGEIRAVDGTQELEIALTAMANAGVKGSEAGTHMRNMLMKLSSPTSEGTEALEAMGVTVFDTEGKMRSLSEIFGMLSDKMDDMTQEEKIQTISELFNARDLSSAEALLNAVSQDWDRIGESILNADGAAQQMADTQLDNLAGDITLFKSALEGAQIAISDALSPTLREFVQFGTESVGTLTDAFNEGGLQGAIDALPDILDKGIQQFSGLIPSAIDIIGKVADAIANNLPETVENILPALLDAMLSLTESLIRNVPELVKTVASAISTAFSGDTLDTIFGALDDLISGMLDLIKESFTAENIQKVAEWIVSFITHATDLVKDNLPDLVSVAAQIITALVDAFADTDQSALIDSAVDLVIVFVDAIVDNLDTILIAAEKLITTIVEKLLEPDNLEKMISAGTTILIKLIEGLAVVVGDLLGFTDTLCQDIADWIVDYDWVALGLAIVNGIAQGILQIDGVQEAVDGFAEIWASGYIAIEDFINNVADLWQTGWDTLEEYGGKVYDAIENFKTKWTEFWDNVNTTLTNKIDGFKERIQDIPNKFNEIVNDATTWGKDMIQNFINGISEKWSALVDKVSGAAQVVRDYLGFSEPEKGPLSNFHTYAPDMIDLFADGIKQNEHKIGDAFNKSLDFVEEVSAPTVVSEQNDKTVDNKMIIDFDSLMRKLDDIIDAIHEGKIIKVDSIDTALGSLQDMNERTVFA